MLDRDGFRPNVGIVITNGQGQVLWARRVGGHDAWQFPQGGVNDGESLIDGLYRELEEETGLLREHVKLLAQTQNWLRYRIPRKFRRYNSDPAFRGQKQHWFLLQLIADDSTVAVDAGDKPEFDDWAWVSFWYPVGQVVPFKRSVYMRALQELAPFLPLPETQRLPGQKVDVHPIARDGGADGGSSNNRSGRRRSGRARRRKGSNNRSNGRRSEFQS
jgi:putative (di)nucleoside polyphosphate hydrolase